MIYTEAEHFIKESHNEVIRLGLGRIEELLERLGCPQKKLKFIHVAGTNGKGSVCAMTAEILKTAGYKTGLFTSPVISAYREQFSTTVRKITDVALFLNISLTSNPVPSGSCISIIARSKL